MPASSGAAMTASVRRARRGRAGHTPPDPVPLRENVDNRLAGQALPRLDAPAKIDGSALFAADVRFPTWSMPRCCSGPWGSRLAGIDQAAAQRHDRRAAHLRGSRMGGGGRHQLVGGAEGADRDAAALPPAPSRTSTHAEHQRRARRRAGRRRRRARLRGRRRRPAPSPAPARSPQTYEVGLAPGAALGAADAPPSASSATRSKSMPPARRPASPAPPRRAAPASPRTGSPSSRPSPAAAMAGSSS